MHLEQNKHLELCLLSVICDRDRSSIVEDALEKYKTFFSLVTFGKGTANSKILSYLGLGETEKAVFRCVLPKEEAVKLNAEINEALEFAKPGRGISFTVKIDNGCYQKPVQFLSEGNKEEHMHKDAVHDLIIVVLNRGYCEDVMEAASAAGATGGTVMNARGCGMSGMDKFFGVVIAPEKEVIWIVATKDSSPDIMAGIAEKTGPTTDAGAVSFTITVNDVHGINLSRIEV